MYPFTLRLPDSFVNETIRLSSGVFMVRYINQDTEFTTSDGKTHIMRKGDRVAMYPPALHKDPEIFEDPLVSFAGIIKLINLVLITTIIRRR